MSEETDEAPAAPANPAGAAPPATRAPARSHRATRGGTEETDSRGEVAQPAQVLETAPATTGDSVLTAAIRLPRGLTVLLAAAAAVIVGAGIKSFNGFVAPVLLALVLTVAVGPVRSWALRHRWPSWAATTLAIVAAYLIVLFLVVSVAVSIVKLATTLPTYADRADTIVSELQQRLSDAGLSKSATSDSLKQLDLGKVVSLLTSVLSSVLGVLTGLFFLVTVLLFLIADASGAGRRAALLRRNNPEVEKSLERFVYATKQYLIVSTVFGGIVAIFDTVALWLMGVPLPALWGLLAFVTNFIPNIGFVIGVIPPALLALLDGGWEKAVLVVVVYSVLNVVIQTFIQPRYVGDAVGLSTSATFLSLGIWTFVLGPLGALLAVPATLLVRAILVDPDPRATWANAFIASTPPAEVLEESA